MPSWLNTLIEEERQWYVLNEKSEAVHQNLMNVIYAGCSGDMAQVEAYLAVRELAREAMYANLQIQSIDLTSLGNVVRYAPVVYHTTELLDSLTNAMKVKE